MKARQAPEGAQVQETEHRENSERPATENSHEYRWEVTLGRDYLWLWLLKVWSIGGVVIYRCGLVWLYGYIIIMSFNWVN